jgi:hypothetical protein
LPSHHQYKNNIKNFLKGKTKRDDKPPIMSSEELYDVMSQYKDIVFDFQSSKQKFSGFGMTYNWIKQSIF